MQVHDILAMLYGRNAKILHPLKVEGGGGSGRV